MSKPTEIEVQLVLFLVDFLAECHPKEGEYQPPSRELVEWAKSYVVAIGKESNT